MSLSNQQLEDLIQHAQQVLENNIRHVDGKVYSIPSGLLYPAAWGWDTPFIALGLYLSDPDTAIAMLTDFTSYQWPNGMLPQIVFPQIKKGEKLDPESYFPPPHVWYYTGEYIADYDTMDLAGVCKHPAYEYTQGKTTGIPQYPIWAMVVAAMHKIKPIPPSELKELISAIDKFHDFFLQERDPLNIGCCAEYHPWIGCDNAPCYDVPMKRVYDRVTEEELEKIIRQRVDVRKILSAGGDPSARPTDHDYACFLYLAQSLARYSEKCWKGEDTTVKDLDFAVYSPMLNSLLIRSDLILANLAQDMSLPDLVKKAQNRAKSIHVGMVDKLWHEDEQRFTYYDAISDEHYKSEFLGAYYPVMDPFLTDKQMIALNERLQHLFIDEYAYPLPSTAKANAQVIPEKEGYKPLCYWRGPTWINLAAMVLDYMQDQNEAQKIRGTLLSLIHDKGFFEYFNPETGEGHGSDRFGWTAAYSAYWAYIKLHSPLSAEEERRNG